MTAANPPRWWQNTTIILVIAFVVCAIALSIALQVLAKYMDAQP